MSPVHTLSSAPCGEALRITGLNNNSPASRRLREIGFCESTEVCKLSEGHNCLCLIMGKRVAIGRDLAGHVLVARLGFTD